MGHQPRHMGLFWANRKIGSAFGGPKDVIEPETPNECVWPLENMTSYIVTKEFAMII